MVRCSEAYRHSLHDGRQIWMMDWRDRRCDAASGDRANGRPTPAGTTCMRNRSPSRFPGVPPTCGGSGTRCTLMRSARAARGAVRQRRVRLRRPSLRPRGGPVLVRRPNRLARREGLRAPRRGRATATRARSAAGMTNSTLPCVSTTFSSRGTVSSCTATSLRGGDMTP